MIIIVIVVRHLRAVALTVIAGTRTRERKRKENKHSSSVTATTTTTVPLIMILVPFGVPLLGGKERLENSMTRLSFLSVLSAFFSKPSLPGSLPYSYHQYDDDYYRCDYFYSCCDYQYLCSYNGFCYRRLRTLPSPPPAAVRTALRFPSPVFSIQAVLLVALVIVRVVILTEERGVVILSRRFVTILAR